jgi:hypothetical protein
VPALHSSIPCGYKLLLTTIPTDAEILSNQKHVSADSVAWATQYHDDLLAGAQLAAAAATSKLTGTSRHRPWFSLILFVCFWMY